MTLETSARNVLTRLGESVTFTYSTGESIDPITGEVTPGTETTVAGFGYPGAYNSNEIDGTLIQQGDIRLTLEKVSAVPQVQWRCTVNSEEYRVENVRRVRQSGADVIYICQLRAV